VRFFAIEPNAGVIIWAQGPLCGAIHSRVSLFMVEKQGRLRKKFLKATERRFEGP